jgi:hypothetical protein
MFSRTRQPAATTHRAMVPIKSAMRPTGGAPDMRRHRQTFPIQGAECKSNIRAFPEFPQISAWRDKATPAQTLVFQRAILPKGRIAIKGCFSGEV